MVEALSKIQALEENAERRVPFATRKNDQKDDVIQEGASHNGTAVSESSSQQVDNAGSIPLEEPSLRNPQVGNPISHDQAIDLSRQLKAQNITPNTLDELLRGARVYIAPPPPKPEPASSLFPNPKTCC